MRLASWIIAALLLTAGVVGITNRAYDRGVAHGAAVATPQGTPRASAPAVGAPQAAPPVAATPVVPPPYPYPYYGAYAPYYYRPFGFGFFGFLFPMLLILLAVRFFFGWRRWGRGSWRGAAWAYGPGGAGVPPMFEEWHRRAHERPEKTETESV